MNLTPTEREILVYLLEAGDDSAPNIADSIGRHAVSVRRSASELEGKGLTRHKGRNVYALTTDGLTVARDLAD